LKQRDFCEPTYISTSCRIEEFRQYDANVVQLLCRLRKKSPLPVDRGPQRLKPDLFSINYVRPKGRTLQQPEFFRSLSGRSSNRSTMDIDVRKRTRAMRFAMWLSIAFQNHADKYSWHVDCMNDPEGKNNVRLGRDHVSFRRCLCK